MKKIYLFVLLSISFYWGNGQCTKNEKMATHDELKGVIASFSDCIAFINYIKTDDLFLISEVIIDKNTGETECDEYYGYRNSNCLWVHNLPDSYSSYFAGVKDGDISWMNLPKLKKRNTTTEYISEKNIKNYLKHGFVYLGNEIKNKTHEELNINNNTVNPIISFK
jgi:hypothetical protein